MFEWWRPATLVHSSPLIGRIAKLLGFKQPPLESTTEQGASASASPSLYQFGLIAQRFERQAIISDVRKLLLDEPRLAKANRKMAREAVRKGVVVSVKPRAGSEDVAEQAQAVIDQINHAAKINKKLFGWAQMLLAEGDLFLQLVVMGDRIIAVKRMPAESMERNTDETDSFADLQNAFSQFDATTQSTIASFAYWQIVHVRWNYVDGERYGTSEYIQSRGPFRKLALVEESQVIRRMTRAVPRRLHNVGTKDTPGKESDIQAYRQRNGLVNRPNDAYDPFKQTTDFYGNGLTSIEALPGDPNIHEIADLRYFQDVAMSGASVPKGILGIDSESINRDVLKDQHAEWLKETVALSEAIDEALRETYHIGLLLAGINPEAVDLVIRFSESNMETASDRVERVLKLREATIGQGRNAVPDPLISKETALAMLAEDLSIQDPTAEIEAIEAELEEFGVVRTSIPAATGSGGEEMVTDTLDDRVVDPAGVSVVVVAVTDPQGRVLMVRRSPGEYRAGEWETPGGHVDPGETLEAAAIREVKEETGLDVVLGNGLTEFPLRDVPGGRGLMVRGHLVGGELALKRDEHDAYKWADPREVAANKFAPLPPRFVPNLERVLSSPLHPGGLGQPKRGGAIAQLPVRAKK